VCTVYKSASCTQDHKWRQYLILLAMYGKCKKNKLSPSTLWKQISHNCFTPVERACDAHFIAHWVGSGAFLGLSDKRFILVPPGNRNPNRSPHILDQGWWTYGSCAQNGMQEDFFGTQNSVLSHLFKFLLTSQRLYILKDRRMCIYTHTWLRKDCISITVATK
jgi:hypothetical protein